MRRLVRYTLNALTGLSLLLCVATVALWVRSLHACDSITWRDDDAKAKARTRCVRLVKGAVQFEEYVLTFKERSSGTLTLWFQDRRGIQVFQDQSPGFVTWQDWHTEQDDERLGAIPWEFDAPDLAHLPPHLAYSKVDHEDYYYLNESRRLVVPFSALVTGFSCLPGLVIATVLRSAFIRLSRRLPSGLCPRCGYDLRATPDRCPECGAVKGAG